MSDYEVQRDETLDAESRAPEPESRTVTEPTRPQGNISNRAVKKVLFIQAILFASASFTAQFIAYFAMVKSWNFNFGMLISMLVVTAALDTLIQVLLYFNPGPALSPKYRGLLLTLFTICEIFICSFIVGSFVMMPILSMTLLISFVFKNVYYTNEIFFGKPVQGAPSQNNQNVSRTEIPKPKFNGGPVVVALIQIITFLLCGYIKDKYFNLDLIGPGAVIQLLVIIHWAYLLHLGYQTKIHSILGYLFAISEVIILVVFYDILFDTAFLVCISIYSIAKCLTILRHIYAFETMSSFLSNFSFIPEIFRAYGLYVFVAICIILALPLSLFLQIIHHHIMWHSTYYAHYWVLPLLTLLVLLRLKPDLTKNTAVWFATLFSMIAADGFTVALLSRVFQYNAVGLFLIISSIILKDFIVIKEHLILRGDYPNPDTRKYRRRILLLLNLELGLILFLFLALSHVSYHYIMRYSSSYLMIALSIVLFVTFELIIVPFLGTKKPVNLIFCLAYILFESYALWTIGGITWRNKAFVWIFIVTNLLKNVSFSAIIEREDLVVEGGTVNVRYMSMTESE